MRVERPERLAHRGRTAPRPFLADRLNLEQPILIRHTEMIPHE